MPSDETALRDEILKLKRQVMVLRRMNEQNLVKFRKYEDEAKRKDREIEQLMDPRKNADVTKVLSTKGAAILMTLKDQNNTLIQMVLNKDVQIRKLLAEMKMFKLYASTRRNASYKEEIARLKNLLAKSQEKLKESLDKENQAKSARPNESSFFEFSSSSERSSPRDCEELRLLLRSLEAHLKFSNNLLNKKDQEISLLNDELNFLKKLHQQKISKKSFDCHPTGLHKYSIYDTHPVPQTRVSDVPPSKIFGTELLQFFDKSPDIDNKILSSSAPACSTRLPASNETISKHKSLSNITGSDNWKDSKVESSKVTKTDATLLHEIAVYDDTNGENFKSKFEKVEKKVKERKKILTKRREAKKRIPKKFGKKKFYENDKKNQNILVLEALESKKKVNGQIISENFDVMESKEKDENTKIREIFLRLENCSDFRSSQSEIELKEIRTDSTNLKVDADKERKALNSNDYLGKDFVMNNVNGGSSEIVRINLPAKVENSRMSDDETNSISFRKGIYRQSFDSSFESESGYPTKQQIQQVQVEVQIDSILLQNDSDELENSIGENSYQREFTETRSDNCAPDDNDNNNDDDNDVIIR